MSNDNDNGTDDGVISLDAFRKTRTESTPLAPKPEKHTFEFHIMTEGADEIVKADGFLKFGPQFLVVVDDYETAVEVVFSVALPLVKYVKRLDADAAVQATLDLR